VSAPLEQADEADYNLLSGQPGSTGPCHVWCMKRTNIYLDEKQAELLDHLAHEQGVSRAEMIRMLLDCSLRSRADDVEVGLAAIDESFGVLADTEWPERRADDREEHLARMWAVGS
jgi:hypothetical protein